ncbi:MAG TPA: MBOAT family protein, partial [Leptospiraceae bacterium]|nr:MBOAT family protein [Leptospiraceae bacterium]
GILVSVIRASFVTSVAAVSVLMFRSNSTEQMVELFRGIFTNRENLLLTEMNGAGLGWLVLGLGLVQSEPAFMLNSVKNLESMLYMFFAFLLFHSFEYWPEKLERFRKFEPWLPFALGLITVFLLATLAQDGDGFIYTTF